ncbi:unnamed protein product [Trichogramma brassicae]|uniref:Peptidase S1 domain-containing protein n=1 Tax=Trichogramma brassicae TaxID=86971 RepID=A0A6H5IHJ2_9HYME|nr:unnamed protein product [Trichogramma brassicae]
MYKKIIMCQCINYRLSRTCNSKYVCQTTQLIINDDKSAIWDGKNFSDFNRDDRHRHHERRRPASVKQAAVSPNGRIYGGEDVPIETYPYQVSIQYGSKHTCGGSIIDNEWILTAGHCVGMPVFMMKIRAGTSTVGKGGTLHRVEKIIRHSGYKVDYRGVPFNDIALIKLRDPIKYDNQHDKIDLYEKFEKSQVGVNATVSGWGETGKGFPVQLQAVFIPIMDTAVCKSAYDGFGGLPDKQICAAYYLQKDGKDSCQGDSGGPLAINYRLVGIVSWGNGCALPEFPGAYTEVAAYRDWIDENMAKM